MKKNSQKWKDFEVTLQNPQANPDHLAELYIELTDDLSYAQTYYENSNTAIYLNTLTSSVHQLIYKNKKENKNRFIQFWKKELPLLAGKYHKQFLYSFIVFAISCTIGAISAKYDPSYVRLILGDSYVNMTLENIKNGDPMGVYKDEGELSMFFYITINNIKVSLATFVVGVLGSFGTGYLLFNNGIMLGSFQYFFHEHNLLFTSALTIWIHGTLEISCIIIAGAAGFVMGNSLLFPGTYSRLESFKRGAKDGMKIAIGIVPIIITAGFLESFATRHTEWPIALKISIISISVFFIIYYFIIYPFRLNLKHHGTN